MPPDLERWRALGHAIGFGTQRIFCVDSAADGAAGDALVLIHGFPTASWDFARLWPALTARFRVVACDLLGFGFSSKPRRHAYSIAGQADLIEAVAAQHGLARFHVLAHDYGDSVAQELLARDAARPEPVLRSVCFLNGGLFPETHRLRPIQRLLRGPLGPLVGRLVTRRSFARSMTAIFGPRTPPSGDDIDAFWALITHADGQRRAHELIRYIDERVAHRERWLAAMQNARCPLALIAGAADPVSGAHMIARYRELVGSGYVAELADIGHYPQIEAPDLVLCHYRRFLAEAGFGAPPDPPPARAATSADT